MKLHIVDVYVQILYVHNIANSKMLMRWETT